MTNQPQPTELNRNQLISDKQAAIMLGTTTSTLSYWRVLGRKNLPWVKVGAKLVKYQVGDILDFIRAQKQVASND